MFVAEARLESANDLEELVVEPLDDRPKQVPLGRDVPQPYESAHRLVVDHRAVAARHVRQEEDAAGARRRGLGGLHEVVPVRATCESTRIPIWRTAGVSTGSASAATTISQVPVTSSTTPGRNAPVGRAPQQ